MNTQVKHKQIYKTTRIDLGLAISGATLQPGRSRTQTEIAAFCGCSHQAISAIEINALKKLRLKLGPELRAEFADILTNSWH